MTIDTSTTHTTGMNVMKSHTAIYTHIRSCPMPTPIILISTIAMSIDLTTLLRC